LPEAVLWSGAYKRPQVGNEKSTPRNNPHGIANRVPGSQKQKTEPIRIVIADSGDLAYEYSKFTLEFDLKSGQHYSTEGGVLRVWQNQGGEWKLAAWFNHPYYND
jgi:ketosteroid isomerase-like protein